VTRAPRFGLVLPVDDIAACLELATLAARFAIAGTSTTAWPWSSARGGRRPVVAHRDHAGSAALSSSAGARKSCRVAWPSPAAAW